MRELAKSLVSCGWAVSVFSAEQMAKLLTMSGNPANAQDLDTVTADIVGKLGSVARTAFVAGNSMQRAALDMLSAGLGLAHPPGDGGTPGGPPTPPPAPVSTEPAWAWDDAQAPEALASVQAGDTDSDPGAA